MRTILIAFLTLISLSAQSQTVITADHSVVDYYDDIPQQWIDSVKTKLLYVHGQSHAKGYLIGLELLDLMYNNTYNSSIWLETAVPAATDTAIRAGRPASGGTNIIATIVGRDNLESNIVQSQNETGNPYDFIVFGWSYWAVWGTPNGQDDPVYNVQWYGNVDDGGGEKIFGLDDDDYSITGSNFNMQFYLNQVDTINQYMIDNGWGTKFFVSSIPPDEDEGTEAAFQRELKNDYIRDNIENTTVDTVYFIDYADILTWDYTGDSTYTVVWEDGETDRPHDQISPQNLKDYDASWNIIDMADDGDHIGEVGAVRLAKAMWYLMARASGWDGLTESEPSTPSGRTNQGTDKRIGQGSAIRVQL